MNGKIIFLLSLLVSLFLKAHSVSIPYPIAIFYNETTFTYVFVPDRPYYTSYVLYKDLDTPRIEMKPNHFDCYINSTDSNRYCVFVSEDPISRLWGTAYSRVCARDVDNPTTDCETYYVADGKFPSAQNVKLSRNPPTSGGEVVISGTYLRVLGGMNSPNEMANSMSQTPLVVKGNFSDPSFNCNNLTVVVIPGSGNQIFNFGEVGPSKLNFHYANPTISKLIPDLSKSVLTINGDNFYIKNSLVQVYFNGIEQEQSNIKITVNHTQIQVSNFSRVDPGPLSVFIKIDKVPTEMNTTYCFPATITSVTSVSNLIGGIVTIKGSKLSSTLNSSLIPTITIGNKQCTFIKSTTTELECQLDPNEDGGKNLSVNVNFGGCDSINSGGAVTFTYNIPTLSNASYSNGTITLNGINLGSNKVSTIQLYGNGINEKINQIQVSPDEKILTFTLPLLKCKLFNINLTRDDISTSTLSISVPLSTNVTNRPSVVNGTLNLELYYIDCPVSSSIPSITVGNSSPNQCSIPSLPSSSTSTSKFYQTTCNTPYGTGIDNEFTFKYNSESINNKFSYSAPIVTSRTFSEGLINITIHGSNFGNSTSKIQVHFNGSDISSEIQTLSDNQFTFKKIESYENGPIYISIDGINMEQSFNLTLPPIIYSIINKDNKTTSCGGIITVSGKNLLTNDEEFKVKVLANNETTTIINPDERILIVRANSKKSPLIVSTFIGKDLIISNVTLTYLEPKIKVITKVKNNKNGISTLIGGISLPEYISASLTLLSGNLSLICNLQCNVLPNETYYYSDAKLSSNETDITNSTDCLSCYSKSIVNEITGVLNIQLGSILYQHKVDIEEIESSNDSGNGGGNDGDKSSKLSGGAIAGITIGSVAAAGALVGCVIYFKLITRAKNSFK